MSSGINCNRDKSESESKLEHTIDIKLEVEHITISRALEQIEPRQVGAVDAGVGRH